ncbi:MAG: S-layer homology domain-containing protein [Firmicutes bacterium]|nr:S-layer homology domain-containing protein [Bacillota bacterium]
MKKLISLAAALILLFSVPVYAASPFTDVRQTDWFASYVETARDLGIVSGYPDGSFRPSRQVTYGEFLAMAMRGKGKEDAAGTHWARKFYDAAIAAEVLDEADVSPRFLDEPIPRRDVALIMAGLLRNADRSGRNVKSADKTFSDVEATDEREYAIALCAYYGTLSGYPDGTFRPLGFLTRAESTAAMVALDGVLGPGQTEPEEPPEEPAEPPKPTPKEPSTREELLEREEEHALVRTGDEQVLTFMDPAVRSYLKEVISSARFVKEDGKYLVKLNWPALPEGCGGKIDVQVCDRNGTGLDGYVWVCRKGMEKMPTYRKDLKEAGSAEFTFDLKDLKAAGSVGLLVTVTAENGKVESSLAFAEQDLTTGKTQVQYKLASDTYQLSGTFDLDAPVFQWK